MMENATQLPTWEEVAKERRRRTAAAIKHWTVQMDVLAEKMAKELDQKPSRVELPMGPHLPAELLQR